MLLLLIMSYFKLKFEEWKNFFSKRSFKSNPLKRTKSVTKLERKRCTLDGDSIPPSRLRTSRSHESLLQSSPNSLATFDLSHGDVQVSALHSSLLGQENCFQMVSNGGTRFYTCRTKEERDRWLYSLKRTIQPNQDNIRRKENSLRIWILEAKGMVGKKSRYYCELWLDKTLYARTSSKQRGDMCFWGEHFEFSGSLPSVENIYVNLYKEADKKKRRDKNVLIGSVHIPVESISGRHLFEKWYPVVSEKHIGSKDNPSIRIKSRYQTVDILPLIVYKDLLQYLKTDYKALCDMLEPVISVRAKEDVATTLVNIMQKENMAKDFLADVVMSDVDKIGDLHLTFRGNSLATKATEAYMKLLGDKYLQETLGVFLKMALDSSDDCEVDPMKVTNNAVLQRQQSHLMTYVEMVWVKIINSANSFPSELQEVFYECRKRLTNIEKEELCENLISASIFLRFLCPAILSPSLFNLSREYPQGKAARNLTLVAKTIQTLANFTRFGGKESFMEFMNGFVEREWSTMKSFLKQISSPSSREFSRRCDFDGYIDLGRELAVLHNLLVESTSRINQKCYFDQVDRLQQILDKISIAVSQPSSVLFSGTNLSSGSPKTNLQSVNFKVNMNNINNNNIHSLSENECHSVKAMHQEFIHAYISNDVNIKSSENIYQSVTNDVSKAIMNLTPCSEPSTLSRNSYFMGSGKKAATDLSTSDDYVLYSALETNQDNKPSNNAKPDELSVSHKNDSNLMSHLTQSCIYGEALNNKTSIISNCGLNSSLYNINHNNNQQYNILNGFKSGMNYVSGEKNGIVLRNVLVSNSKTSTSTPVSNIKNSESSQVSADKTSLNSSPEIEVTNTKGSQISLSTVASSGYQSFPYSQSNSPVDPTFQVETNKTPSPADVNTNSQAPLAFNNPMYHFPTPKAIPTSTGENRARQKNLRLSNLYSFNSMSAEDILMLCRTSQDHCCCSSSSSSGTASCSSTPPLERRNMHFKSTAPRTNPHFSGSQHSCTRGICSFCSPKLNCRSLCHPKHSRYHYNKSHLSSNVATTVNKKNNKNHLPAYISPVDFNEKISLSSADIDNCNIQMSETKTTSADSYSDDKNYCNNNNKADKTVINNFKTVEDYEQEVEELRNMMIQLQNKLTDAENKLIKQETTTEQVVADWQARLEAGEERIRKQQEEKDQQMKNIITRLITVEEELRREQHEMQGVIVSKQKIIDAQERKIKSLDATNARLLGALSQLKERYQIQGCNGNSISSPNSPVKLAVLENTDPRFKSSSC